MLQVAANWTSRTKRSTAFLAWHDIQFRKTHSLEELGERRPSIDRSLEPLAQAGRATVSVVQVVQQHELLGHRMLVGRDGSSELDEIRVAVPLREIAEDLIVASWCAYQFLLVV